MNEDDTSETEPSEFVHDPNLGPNIYKSATGEYVYVPSFTTKLDLSKLPDPFAEEEDSTPDTGDNIPVLASDVRRNPSKYGITIGPRGQDSGGFGMNTPPDFEGEDTTQKKMHDGHDYVRGAGAGIVAALGGTITRTDDPHPERRGQKDGGWGNQMKIEHRDGTSTDYSHLDAMYFSTGDEVEAGTIIGEIGASGRAKGVHLHFRTFDKSGKVMDPAVWFKEHPDAYFPVAGK